MSAPKLFYSPTSCGAASYIVATAGKLLGSSLQSEQVDLKTHKTLGGEDLFQYNPKGNVPALVLPDGSLLNENVAVLQYLGDKCNESNSVYGARMMPKRGSIEYYKLQNRLGWLASELHKTFGPVFAPNLSNEAKASNKEKIAAKLTYLATKEPPAPSGFLLGPDFCPADAYLYVMLKWAPMAGIELARDFPVLHQYSQRVQALPFVQQAEAEMNLIASGGQGQKAGAQTGSSQTQTQTQTQA